MGREREKPCDRCVITASTLFRVQLDEASDWQLICRDCYDRLAPDNSHYRYGGTWKAKKRH
jgi:hypothetical protein